MNSNTNIAMRNTAKEAVLKAIVTPINSVKCNAEHFQKFKKSVFDATRTVFSTAGGGGYSHTFLPKDNATYTVRMGRTSYTEATHPGALNFTGATTNA